jgi:hypothetical protein
MVTTDAWGRTSGNTPRPPTPHAEPTPPPGTGQSPVDQVRESLRVRHFGHRTEEAYTHWIRHYIFLHHKRQPRKWRSTVSVATPSGGPSPPTGFSAVTTSGPFSSRGHKDIPLRLSGENFTQPI